GGRERRLAGPGRVCGECTRRIAGRRGRRGRALGRTGGPRRRRLRGPLRRLGAARRLSRPHRGAAMNRRVLFVDDEPAVLEGIRRNLRKDFDVHTETNPRAALAALEKVEPFAVIVADMRMPGMDGVDFLYHARKAAPGA